MQNANLVPGNIYVRKDDSTQLVFVADLRKLITDNIPAHTLEKWPLIFLIEGSSAAVYPADVKFTEWAPPPVPVKKVAQEFAKQMKRVSKIDPDSDALSTLKELQATLNKLLEGKA